MTVLLSITGGHESYQSSIKRHIGGQKSLYLYMVAPFHASFPLDGRGRLAGDVIDNTVNAGNFVDNSDADFIQHVIRDTRPIGGHEVAGSHSPQRQGVIIGTAVSHDTYTAGIGEHRKILVDSCPPLPR